MPREVTLWISKPVLSELMNEGRRHAPVETGGILVGYTADLSDAVVVTDHIDSGPRALRTMTNFEPDYEYQESQLATKYSQSSRRWTYVGDWHTHPGGLLTMSAVDKRTLRAIAQHAPARVAEPIMIIIGGRASYDVAAWRWHPRSGFRPGHPRQIRDIRIF